MKQNDDSIDVIEVISRKDAIADDILIDITELAQIYYGFKVPVAITSSLKVILSEFPQGKGEDFAGRLHDLLFLASVAARRESKPGSEKMRRFKMSVTELSGQSVAHELFMLIGPGDEGEPVITIGFPEDF